MSSTNWFSTGMAVCTDPVHQSIEILYPLSRKTDEITERTLIDTPWVQRLRQIHQLQSTLWVYPGAEHSRFTHVLGVMHLAGYFGKNLYPSLKEIVGKDCPSLPYIEETLRLTGLLHDLGHGPFGHFFDTWYLDKFGITHEDISQKIIIEKLGDIIRQIRRSPSGYLAENEELNPEHIAFLIKKPELRKKGSLHPPRWLELLLPLFSGIYTVDNLDYVIRDSYMSGIATTPVHLKRLLFYSFYTDKGFTLHRNGIPALKMFLQTRRYLYENLYYHRTVRAIDLHMEEIFTESIKIILKNKNPINTLETYRDLTDQYLLAEVHHWSTGKASAKRKHLGEEWKRITERRIKYKMAFETDLQFGKMEPGRSYRSKTDYQKQISAYLAQKEQDIFFRIDMPSHDPRPENISTMGENQIFIYEPSTGSISSQVLQELFEDIPFKITKFRLYAETHENDKLLCEAAEWALKSPGNTSIPTNV